MRIENRYPEGWIDPEVFGSVLLIVVLIIIGLIALIMIINDMTKEWAEEDRRREMNRRISRD